MLIINLVTLFSCFVSCFSKVYIIKTKDITSVDFQTFQISILETFNIGDLTGIVIETDLTKNDLKNMDFVEEVEENDDVNINPIENIVIQRKKFDENNIYQWGLDRIDQTNLPLDNVPFVFSENQTDIFVYVLDTGIRISHKQFEGRAIYGINILNTNEVPGDGHGHGTHVSSLITGKDVGISRAKVVAVKVLSDFGFGSFVNIVKGIEWSVKDSNDKNRCSVISMSLGGKKSKIINEAVENARKEGVRVVVAAGNDVQNACLKSPSSSESAITVASSTIEDKMSTFSNFGKCVDIFAPGSEIIGAWKDDDTSMRILSGTSMSCPHVSGVLSVFLSRTNCQITDREFLRLSVKNKIENTNRSPNRLVHLILQTPTESPTKRPSSNSNSNRSCPPTRAILYCNAKKSNGKLRNQKSCNTGKWGRICRWCDKAECRPNVDGVCENLNVYNKCLKF